MFVRTLLGDINPKELRITNGHEHLVCRPPYWVEKKQEDLILDDVEASLKDVLDFKNAGGNTIVDATAIDYGRDVQAVVDISKRSRVNVIGTAGFNKSFLWEANIPEHLRELLNNYTTFNEWIERSSVNDLVEHVVREVEQGLENTSYKAGQVKFGTGYNSITPLEEKTIRVIAKAHHVTKAPIHSHTEAGTMALEQIEILKSEDVDLSFVSFGHMDRNIDPYYYNQIVKTGAFLSFDGLGKNKYAPESDRINAIINLIKKGYKNQILLGGDTARKSYYRHYGKFGLGLGWFLEKWVVRFEDECNLAGLDGKEIINTLLVDNPVRYLVFK